MKISSVIICNKIPFKTFRKFYSQNANIFFRWILPSYCTNSILKLLQLLVQLFSEKVSSSRWLPKIAFRWISARKMYPATFEIQPNFTLTHFCIPAYKSVKWHSLYQIPSSSPTPLPHPLTATPVSNLQLSQKKASAFHASFSWKFCGEARQVISKLT